MGLWSLPMTPEEIKAARKALGLTQAQLAQVMGYAYKSYVGGLEIGSSKISAQGERLLQAYLAGYRPEDWPE